MGINFFICDDNENQIKELKNIIKNYCEDNKIEFSCDYTTKSLLAVEIITKNTYDIILLDIKIDKLNGIEVADKIREVDNDILIIFITSHLNYTHEAFDKFAFNYIVKPICNDIINKTLARAIKRVKEKEYCYKNMLELTFENNNNILNLKYCDITLFEKQGKKIIIYKSNNENLQINKTFKSLENMINNDVFIRCHKGFIVNKYKICSFKYGKLKVEGYDIEIPVGRKYQKLVKKNIFKII